MFKKYVPWCPLSYFFWIYIFLSKTCDQRIYQITGPNSFPKLERPIKSFIIYWRKGIPASHFIPPPHFHLRFSMCVHELLSNVHFCNQKVFEKSFQWLLRTSEDGICSSVEFLPKDEPQQLGKILDIMGRWVWSPPPLPLWLLPPFKYFLIPRLNTLFIATFKLTKKVPHYQHVIKPHYWKGIVIRDRKRHN